MIEAEAGRARRKGQERMERKAQGTTVFSILAMRAVLFMKARKITNSWEQIKRTKVLVG